MVIDMATKVRNVTIDEEGFLKSLSVLWDAMLDKPNPFMNIECSGLECYEATDILVRPWSKHTVDIPNMIVHLKDKTVKLWWTGDYEEAEIEIDYGDELSFDDKRMLLLRFLVLLQTVRKNNKRV